MLLKMEHFETTVNVDELFDLWKSVFEEIKRKVLGKYTKETESFDIEDRIYVYKGREICNHKFNYLFPGNRCKMCSSLLMLNDVSEFTEDHIQIEHGKHKGDNISIECYPREQHFGKSDYVKLSPTDILSLLSPVHFYNDEFYSKVVPFVVRNGDIDHYVILSSLFNELGINSRFLCAYLCNKVRIVKLVPRFIGTLNGISMSLEIVMSIIQNIADYCNITNMVHNDNSMKYLSFDFKDSNIVVYLDPSPKTTFSVKGYHERHIMITSANQSQNVDVDIVPTGCLFTNDGRFTNYGNFTNVSPIIEDEGLYYFEYMPSSEELFSFTEQTGMNVFKPFQLYLWFTVLLCEKAFYDLVPFNILEYMYIGKDLTKIRKECKKRHGKVTTYEDVKEIMIKLNIKMRPDLIIIIDQLIAESS